MLVHQRVNHCSLLLSVDIDIVDGDGGDGDGANLGMKSPMIVASQLPNLIEIWIFLLTIGQVFSLQVAKNGSDSIGLSTQSQSQSLESMISNRSLHRIQPIQF